MSVAVAPHAPLTGLRAATEALGPLSLRERSDLLRDALLADLPGDYASFAATVRTRSCAARSPTTSTT